MAETYVDLDMKSKEILNVATPTETSSAANKAYADLYGGISDQDASDFDDSGITTNSIIDSVSVTVASGEYVLILCDGSTNVDDTDDTGILLRRATTNLTQTYDIRCDVDSLNNDIGFSLHYLDTSPGTGTVSYNLYGTADGTITGRLTAIVFRPHTG